MTRKRNWKWGLCGAGAALAVSAAMVVPVAGAAAGGGVPVRPAAPAVGSTVVAVRAAHHLGYDRLVFEFDGYRAPAARVAKVPRLIADFSGEPVPIAGRAILRVVIQGRAHDDDYAPTADTSQAFALPQVMVIKNAGDFEGVLTVGVGLAQDGAFHVHRFTNPGRLAVDVPTPFAWRTRAVNFLDRPAFVAGTAPYTRRVLRPVPAMIPVTGLLDRLFAGPTNAERASGLRFVRSGATGFANVSVSNAVARLRLTGGCSSGGSTFTIANEIMPTLRRVEGVDWVKIYDPAGRTEYPTGRRDSIPECLEP